MKKLLFPIVLLLIGVGSGVGAGLFLKPDHTDDMLANGPCGDVPHNGDMSDGANHGDGEEEDVAIDESREYARLNNQFVVPVVDEGRVVALVVMSLSLEVPSGGQELVFSHEPKLRDVFLQVLFDHANIGGFHGSFTSTANMTALRSALLDVAHDALGEHVTDVLIVDIVRQDV